MAHLQRITKRGERYYRVRHRGKDRVFKKYADAQEYLRRLNRDENPSRTTIEALATRWREEHVSQLAHNTQGGYNSKLDLYIIPMLGALRVDDITPAQYAKWLDDVARLTSAPTANATLRILRSMVRWGRGKGIASTKILDDIRTLNSPPPAPARPLSPREVERAAAACSRLRDATLIRFAAYTGLRWSELRALEWGDIDTDTRIVMVRRAMASDRRGHTKPPKSGKPRPVIMISPAVTAIREWREHAPDVDLVFPNKTGGPLGATWRRTVLNAEIRKAVPDLQMHHLRDTYASILIATGEVSVGELTLRMGHSSVQTTLSRYGALLDAGSASFVSKADALVERLLARSPH